MGLAHPCGKRPQLVNTHRAAEINGPASAVGRHITTRSIRSDFDFTKKILGTGYSGSVVLAKGKQDGKNYAVKSFAKSRMGWSEKQLLRSEVEIHMSLDHPHIVRLEHVYETNKEVHCVFECMEGGELFNRLTKCKKFSETRAAQAVRQLLLALAYMHGQGVVHRDIKLENALYEQEHSEHLKLIDFGFATLYDGEEMLRERMGTLKYSAPEIEQGQYTEKVDMYSLGVLTFAMLTGTFPHDKAKQRLRQSKQGAYDFVRSLLMEDPRNRISAGEALQHPWIRNFTSGLVAVDSSILQTLQDYSRVSTLRRACLQLAAWSLPLKDHAELREQFAAMDVDQNGTIELAELCDALARSPGVQGSDAEQLFKSLDSNSDDKIGYSEFVAATLLDKERLSEDAMLKAFRRFDRDSSGEITPDEISVVFGSTSTTDEACKLLEEADYDGNGAISYDEFRRYLQDDCCSRSTTRRSTPTSWAMKPGSTPQIFQDDTVASI